MQKRFRKTRGDRVAEVWVDLAILRYTVELYENGEFIGSKKGRRSVSEEKEVFLSGTEFSALVHIQPDGRVRCTWPR